MTADKQAVCYSRSLGAPSKQGLADSDTIFLGHKFVRQIPFAVECLSGHLGWGPGSQMPTDNGGVEGVSMTHGQGKLLQS